MGLEEKKILQFPLQTQKKKKKKFNWKPKFNNLNYILRTALEWEKNN